MGRPTRRLRVSLAENYAVALVIVLLLGVAGGYLVYTTHVEPGTTTGTKQVSSWTATSEFTHRATVTTGTAAFERGTVLKNRSVYFQQVAPRLNGSFQYRYTASDGGNLSVSATTILVLRSVGEQATGNSTVYWQVRRPLRHQRVSSLRPDEQIAVPFSMNVTRQSGAARRIDQQLGGSPGQTELSVVARVQVSGTRNGKPVDTTNTYRLGVQPQGGVYQVEDPGIQRTGGETTEQVTMPAEYGPIRRFGSLLLVVVSVAALLGLTAARRTGRLTLDEHERERLAYLRTRDEFDDWISTGHVGKQPQDEAVVEVDSLEGLVDVAIDTDSRVIEDRDTGDYLVHTDNLWYRFEQPMSVTATPDSATTSADSGDAVEDGDKADDQLDSFERHPTAGSDDKQGE